MNGHALHGFMQKTILIIEDRPDVRISATYLLEDNHYQVVEAESPELAKILVKQQPVHLILLDMNYALDTTSGEEGLSFLRWLNDQALDVPVVAMTAWANVALAVKAMQLGAGDFIEKPWKNQRLLQVISQQLSLSGLKQQNQKLKQQLDIIHQPQQHYQWKSECMLTLMRQIKSVAATDVAILFSGENGTGKSELAKLVHAYCRDPQAPFVSVNMGAISESLFESEMFGHTKGAFTDAKSNRIGRFELASHGTLFLDEIANVPVSQQAKLLRVLETGEFEALGSSRTQQAHVRLVSATNANLKHLIENEKFREDLYYRVNTIEFNVPSLKERDKDILPLAMHFMDYFCHKYHKAPIELTECAQRLIQQYSWPGNIRELSHLMERAVLLSDSIKITAQELPISPNNTAISALASDSETIPFMTLASAEKQLIRQALNQTQNSVPQAAKLLGLGKSSLYRRLEKYNDIV